LFFFSQSQTIKKGLAAFGQALFSEKLLVGIAMPHFLTIGKGVVSVSL